MSTTITFDSAEASLDLAFEVADEFGLNLREAEQIAREVGDVVANWDKEAAQMGLSRAMIDRMESAFEHRDLEAAKALSE